MLRVQSLDPVHVLLAGLLQEDVLTPITESFPVVVGVDVVFPSPILMVTHELVHYDSSPDLREQHHYREEFYN